MDINGNTATGSGFGKLNFTGLFLSVIQLEFVIIERLSALIVDSGLGYVEKSNIGEWCNGSIPVSKTVGQGSNPCSPAKIFLINS